MYAIFSDGGHQYKAEVGKELYVDVRDIEPGTDLVLDKILAASDGENIKIGQPYLFGKSLNAGKCCGRHIK